MKSVESAQAQADDSDSTHVGRISRLRQMRVHTQSCPVRLGEAPEDILCGFVYIGTT